MSAFDPKRTWATREIKKGPLRMDPQRSPTIGRNRGPTLPCLPLYLGSAVILITPFIGNAPFCDGQHSANIPLI